MRCALLVLRLAGATAALTPAPSPQAAPPTHDDWAEVNRAFTFRGEPIHPGVIALLQGEATDVARPVITSIDVSAAYRVNPFFQATVTVGAGGRMEISYGKGKGDFAYHWFGKINDTHVLGTWDHSATGTESERLLFTHFERPNGFLPDGPTVPRLVLTIDRMIVIGEKVTFDVKLDGGKVHLTVHGKSGDKEIVLDAPPARTPQKPPTAAAAKEN